MVTAAPIWQGTLTVDKTDIFKVEVIVESAFAPKKPAEQHVLTVDEEHEMMKNNLRELVGDNKIVEGLDYDELVYREDM